MLGREKLLRGSQRGFGSLQEGWWLLVDMQRGDPHLASCWHGVWASLSSSQLVAWLSDQRLRATAPGHGTCRHSHHPTTSGRSPSIQHRHQKGHQRAEPPSAIGFSRADGSSLRSEILKPTFHCRGEWREREQSCVVAMGEHGGLSVWV